MKNSIFILSPDAVTYLLFQKERSVTTPLQYRNALPDP